MSHGGSFLNYNCDILVCDVILATFSRFGGRVASDSNPVSKQPLPPSSGFAENLRAFAKIVAQLYPHMMWRKLRKAQVIPRGEKLSGRMLMRDGL